MNQIDLEDNEFLGTAQVLIVALVISLAVTVFMAYYAPIYFAKAKLTEFVSVYGPVRANVSEHYAVKGVLPTHDDIKHCPECLGFSKSKSGLVITAMPFFYDDQYHFKTNVGGKNYITVSPVIDHKTQRIEWYCGYTIKNTHTTVNPLFLPVNCR